MANKTMEDWFLRGGERPAQEDAPVKPDSPHECDACDECDGHHHWDDEEEVLQDWIVTMSRTKTVEQTAKVRVKAHSEEEALDLIEDQAERESEMWPWEDDDDTEEFADAETVEAEVDT